MTETNIIGFNLPSEENGFLSNRYPAEFKYAGVIFTDAVQYLTYHKVMLGGRYDLAREIMGTGDPEKMLTLAGDGSFPEFVKIKNKWHWICRTVMKRAVYARFMQHPQLREKLLATGNSILCECSHGDRTWGVGISLRDMRWKNPENWTGNNYYGGILMEVRDEIRQLMSSLGEDDLHFADASDAAPNSEWSMSAAALRRHPAYEKSVMAYMDTFANNFTRQSFMDAGRSLADWEKLIRSGEPAAIPVLGFFDLKQDVYDISRRLYANASHDRISAFCSRYMTLLDLFRHDEGLRAWANGYLPNRRGDEHAGLAELIYNEFVPGAKQAGLMPADYYETIDSSALDVRMISNPEDAWLGRLSRRELIACCAWHFRADYFAEGTLLRHSIGDGALIKFFEALI